MLFFFVQYSACSMGLITYLNWSLSLNVANKMSNSNSLGCAKYQTHIQFHCPSYTPLVMCHAIPSNSSHTCVVLPLGYLISATILRFTCEPNCHRWYDPLHPSYPQCLNRLSFFHFYIKSAHSFLMYFGALLLIPCIVVHFP